MEITFSVILPVKNGGAYVKECIESVLAQTHRDFNFIILDNNSTDGTTAYIESLKDPRILHLRSNEDLSMPDNWKRALKLPSNEYITFIGHDDLLYKDYLRTMQQLILEYPEASIYQTHFTYMNAAGAPVRPCQPMPRTMDIEAFLEGEFRQTIDSMGTGYMFRSSDFMQCGGFDTSYPNLLFADYQLFAELTAGSFMAVSPAICFAYRLHTSLSISTGVDLYRKAFERYIGFLNRLRKENALADQAIKNWGAHFLSFYCRSLSHRLAKAPLQNRYTVGRFVQACRQYARLLGIAEKFKPYRDPTIVLAALLDATPVTGNLYRLLRR
ncbi:glycosyltransferase [Niabella sp. CC-SYL272]|uniref:glycosyltransferase n=1 Tax=Niabella agricola TaxID=2891571 RepID=UPI001F16D1C4|nr:glycosyltransferase [Niabella agricola]MCF3108492.1 glycosyltransferase [Niabella agricola]